MARLYKDMTDEEKNIQKQRVIASKNKRQKRIPLDMLKEEAEKLDDFCKQHGYTRNGFIKSAIREKMDREEG